MKINEIAPEIDFADSEYKKLEMNNDNLTVLISSWDEKNIKITFFNVVQFTYRAGDVIKGLFQVTETSNLNDALSLFYDSPPANHPFKLFQIIDIYDIPFIEVIAEKATVNKN